MTADADATRDGGATGGDRDDHRGLAAVVERREGRSDYRTVYPAEVDGADVYTRWFSADDAAFADLEETR